ncbi:hypothetical protein [Lampropedia cohaerens]|uniref:hypothetical protein n=1 Tax=Lampropedia cohaerens TaxID=1610491 RepID=UPI000A07CE19|nr:hypothetical protein [Lampropedia cohaerens]
MKEAVKSQVQGPTIALAPPAQVYLVGGAVRDRLLGRPVHDRDWVVVGATPQHLLDQGFVPVGKDFPVFLHPDTHEEYALARTERKSGKGYKGFAVYASPDVTLEQDLARRDLTINAMAERVLPDGRIEHIDPFGGAHDLQHRLLRHVTEAFAEDPLRVLRVARFAARFGDFTVAPETMALMRTMVQSGELDQLVPERIWQELARGLMEPYPVRMFEVLQTCGALPVLLPALAQAMASGDIAHSLPMRALTLAAASQAPLAVRYACVFSQCEESGLEAVAQRLKTPLDAREVAAVLVREQATLARAEALSAQACMQLLERCDALRRPQRFAQVLWASACVEVARRQPDAAEALAVQLHPARQRMLEALAATQQIDRQAITRQAQEDGLRGPQMGARIRAAQITAIAAAKVPQPTYPESAPATPPAAPPSPD